MFCLNLVDILLFLRQSHHAPRSITVLVLLLVGIVRVHFLYLKEDAGWEDYDLRITATPIGDVSR
jgi:hypothetical protein